MLLITVFSMAFIPSLTSVKADAASAYSFEIEAYDVVMDVKQDYTIDVTEEITVYFTGYDSHGIIRDFSFAGGAIYQNIKAGCDNSDFYYYYEDDDEGNFISVYLKGENVITGQTRTYFLTYQMILPENADYIPLDVIGYGWDTTMKNVSATVSVPVSFSELQYKIYSGHLGSKQNEYVNKSVSNNRIILLAENLPQSCGITLDLKFESGVLTKPMDLIVLWSFVVGLIVLGFALFIKLVFCKQPLVIPTVNFDAPDGMDPLMMGKLIDNQVDLEDMGSLIFWFADQGFITIDLEDKDDPILLRTDKPIPNDWPVHLKQMLQGLFNLGKDTRISSLKNSFYTTADKVKMSVGSVSSKIFSKKCFALLALSTLIGIVASIVFGLVLGSSVIHGYMYKASIVFAMFAFIPNILTSIFSVQLEYKKGKKFGLLLKTIGLVGGIALPILGGFLFSDSYMPIMSILSVAIYSTLYALAGMVTGLCLVRTKEYATTLGQIVGFKNFIQYTEKDRIKVMLEENPELYYHILPYAQVLGVTKVWIEKFNGLSLNAPNYVRYRSGDIVWDYLVWNHVFSSFNSHVTFAMISRPSSSGGKFGGGGFGGGFGGGGFGGGGGRGC